jgi:hypothetical protein
MSPSSLTFSSTVLLALFSSSGCSGQQASATDEGHGHGHGHVSDPRAEIEPVLDYPLDPRAGSQIGFVFESYLSPQQEGGDESETPDAAPPVFKSTKPSVDREERPARGHGILVFTKDFSRAYVQLAITDLDPNEIVMAHIHCGKPGHLGPILVDFSKTGDVKDYFADGTLNYEVRNRDLELVIDEATGLVGAFTAGCPIEKGIPLGKVRTIGGMATIAREGELYFNIHTESQTFFGDIRGQLLAVER